MYLGQGYATATADLELTSLMLEFRAFLDGLASGHSKLPNQLLEKLKKELFAAKAFLEGVRSGTTHPINGAEMFSLLIDVENPHDWNEFLIVLENRLRQIDDLAAGSASNDELRVWAEQILQALQQRGREEELKGRTWWSP